MRLRIYFANGRTIIVETSDDFKTVEDFVQFISSTRWYYLDDGIAIQVATINYIEPLRSNDRASQ
jgi:hypothetical protein